MASRLAGTSRREWDDGMTPAQWYSLIVGGVLLLVGILGFFVDTSFDTGSNVQGDSLLGFEVNGWHNLVHLASGAVGLALFRNRPGARAFALGFGAVYAVVAVWGLVTGDQVLGLVPVNGADNILHIVLAVAGIGAGLASREAYAADRADARAV